MISNPKQHNCKKCATLKKAIVKKDKDKFFNNSNSGEFGAKS